MTNLLALIPLLSGTIGIAAAALLFVQLRRNVVRNVRMAEIAGDIALGVRTYLSRQFRTVLIITPLLAIVIGIVFEPRPWVAVTFLLGVATSLGTAFLGMNAAVRANVKTAEEATESPEKAFFSAVMGGSVMGFSIIGFSLLVLTILYLLFRNPAPLIGFGFGASLAALFAQIGGGIYTKSADVGADLVGKVEKNIPEDDPRNPAVVADLVGDNVGDCAGRGSDLFESFSDDIITGTIVSTLYATQFGPAILFFPLVLQSVGLFSSLLGVFSMRLFRKRSPNAAFNLGLGVTAVIAAVGCFLAIMLLLRNETGLRDALTIFLGAFLGIVTMLVASLFTRYYAGGEGRPVKQIAAASKRGVALNLITGIGYGLQSPLASIVMITVAVSIAFLVSGGSLLAVIAVNIGTDMLIGYIMTADAFGPISDNAAGIAEMAKAGRQTVRALSALDAVGNTMKATTKAYAMASGTVTAFVIFSTFFTEVKLPWIEVSTPYSLAFLFLGIALPYLISSLVIGSTAKTAQQMVDEVRRQFQQIKGLMEGKAKPDYAACVDIATRHALREMILPGVISVAIPALIGLAFGAWALGAFLVGAVLSAALLGPFFNNTGTAFDNAKKLIEDQGLKGTPEHAAAVSADTVGDPMKDVAGPSLLIFMKLVGMAALLIAGIVK
jgi:K(+)-stimulated pyrophosphate-energized sodium pump